MKKIVYEKFTRGCFEHPYWEAIFNYWWHKDCPYMAEQCFAEVNEDYYFLTIKRKWKKLKQ